MEKKERPKIEIGFRMGKLTVVADTGERKNGYTIWMCACDCGGATRLDTRTLQRGTVRDCGCMAKVKPGQKDLTGQRFGRLVAIEPTQERSAKGATVWKCRCDCGEETLAPVTQLTQGFKKSCGCLSHPPIKNYVGKRFGQLTVKGYAGKASGMHRWECLCDCGNTTIVGQTLLQSGKTKSCGCLGHPPVQDIQGQQFGDLTAIAFEGSRNGQYYWRCKCSCGNETSVRQNSLLIGKTKSCSCLRTRTVMENMQFIDGTSVTLLEANRRRLIRTNTSGYNGVYFNRKSQKWVAQITFKKETYYLGAYTWVEEAAKIRREAEAQLFGNFLDWYYKTHPDKKPMQEGADA